MARALGHVLVNYHVRLKVAQGSGAVQVHKHAQQILLELELHRVQVPIHAGKKIPATESILALVEIRVQKKTLVKAKVVALVGHLVVE